MWLFQDEELYFYSDWNESVARRVFFVVEPTLPILHRHMVLWNLVFRDSLELSPCEYHRS